MYRVVTLAALLPLGAGIFFFGFRAAAVAVLAIASCAILEEAYYRLTRQPALAKRSHAYLTGVLLALTLPAFVPWYVPVVGAAFAIIVGKAIFGGVGHFLWQPALVGRLAVAVLFAPQLAGPAPQYEGAWPVLAPNHVIRGDLLHSRRVATSDDWKRLATLPGADALLLDQPSTRLRGLTRTPLPTYSALAYVPIGEDQPALFQPRPAALTELPPVNDLLYGAWGGGIGETCAILIILGGVYLIYRNYVKWVLPLGFIVAAALVAALAPVQLQGPGDTVIFGWGPPGGWSWQGLWAPLGQWAAPPLLREGLDVGLVYVAYQLLGCELLLAAFFLATETTSRPVTGGGQLIFGAGCGVLAMLLKLYVNMPIPAYVAVLIMNSLVPLIDAAWRPRVFGRRRLAWVFSRKQAGMSSPSPRLRRAGTDEHI